MRVSSSITLLNVYIIKCTYFDDKVSKPIHISLLNQTIKKAPAVNNNEQSLGMNQARIGDLTRKVFFNYLA